MIKKGIKARPHDVQKMIDLFDPQVIEIHASSEDLEKPIDGRWDQQLVVHLPEYEGSDLLDPASADEKQRLKAERFYDRAVARARVWAKSFRGTPKVILHPGGHSIEPLKSIERDGLYANFKRTVDGMNLNGVSFLVENLPPLPYFYGGTWHCNIFLDPKETRDYCLGNGWGLCLDLCHLYLYCNHVERLDFMKSIAYLKPVTSHFHISGAEGTNGEGLAMEKGTLPVARVLNYIKSLQVGLVSERWWGHADDGKGFKEDWDYMSKILYGRNGDGDGTH